MTRRLPLPTTMRFSRSTQRRAGRSARVLLVAAWRRAFGVADETVRVFIASNKEVA